MHLQRFVLASLLGCTLVAPLAAADNVPPQAGVVQAATPVTAVTTAVQALRANDLVAWFDALPESQRAAWAQPPANPEPSQRGNRRGGDLGMLRGFMDEQRSAQLGNLLGGFLVQLAAINAPPGTPPLAAPEMPEDQRMLAFLPRMLAAGAMGGAAASILAQGLETRQIAALDGLAASYRTWAASAELADPTRATAALPHLQATMSALRVLGEAERPAAPRELLATVSAAMPHFKLSLAAYGLDLDAILATATVSLDSETAGRAVVVLRFAAWGADHAIPLVLTPADGGWKVAADSPVVAWLRPAFMGMPMGGRGQPGRPPRGGAPRGGEPAIPADQPAEQQPRNF